MRQAPMDTPPESGTFHRVLRHRIVSVTSSAPPRFQGYVVNLKSQRIEHPDGKRAMTIFFPIGTKFEASADRAMCMKAWEDVTTMWHKASKSAAPAIVEPEPEPVAMNDGDNDAADPGEAVDFVSMSFRELQAYAKANNLSGSGTRDELIERMSAANA